MRRLSYTFFGDMSSETACSTPHATTSMKLHRERQRGTVCAFLRRALDKTTPLDRSLILLSFLSGVVACSGEKTAHESAQKPVPPAMTPVAGRSDGGAIAADQEDGQWVRPAKNYASTRFSGLKEITADNARNLRLAWTFETGVLRGQEAAPLVVNNTMYIVTPFPNYLYALDLTKPGAPMKWVYKPAPIAAAQGVACCDVVNRGAAYADGKIVYNTLDDQTVAVDAVTGLGGRAAVCSSAAVAGVPSRRRCSWFISDSIAFCCSSILRSCSRRAAFSAFTPATSLSRLPGEDAGVWP